MSNVRFLPRTMVISSKQYECYDHGMKASIITVTLLFWLLVKVHGQVVTIVPDGKSGPSLSKETYRFDSDPDPGHQRLLFVQSKL
jgi:hypothetical protein